MKPDRRPQINLKTDEARIKAFKSAVANQPHIKTVTAFFEGAMDAAIEADRKGLIVLPVKFAIVKRD